MTRTNTQILLFALAFVSATRTRSSLGFKPAQIKCSRHRVSHKERSVRTDPARTSSLGTGGLILRGALNWFASSLAIGGSASQSSFAWSSRSNRWYSGPPQTALFLSEFDDDEGPSSLISKHKSASVPSSSSSSSGRQQKSVKAAPSPIMSTGLCIVPPDDAWDVIQRARHLARDSTFYKWPPAIRLFHPFAPKREIPSIVGKLAEYVEENEIEPFEVTLDSLLVLPHWEVLEARIEELDRVSQQTTLGESPVEAEDRERRKVGLLLIEEEERRGLERKTERENARKRRNWKKVGRPRRKQVENESNISNNSDRLREDEQINGNDDAVNNPPPDGSLETEEEHSPFSQQQSEGFDGPCVVYLSPCDESRFRLAHLRESLRSDLFPMYDGFSTASSVSPAPEQLPQKQSSNSFRPLLPIAQFSTVADAVKIAKLLQRVWEPLTFNVTDLQFVSREDHGVGVMRGDDEVETGADQDDWDIPEVKFRQKHGTLSATGSPQRVALTSTGEIDAVTRGGIYGCDAMVMLLGEEPTDEEMEEDASLALLMDDNGEDCDEENVGENDTCLINGDANEQIDYNEIFTTAEREYQRMQAHEDQPPSGPPHADDVDIENWLDEDGLYEDEGATIVIGRAQFFMGAMREYVGMPASSAMDAKDRILGSGVSAVARRRGAVHRNSESWHRGDYGHKEQDNRS